MKIFDSNSGGGVGTELYNLVRDTEEKANVFGNTNVGVTESDLYVFMQLLKSVSVDRGRQRLRRIAKCLKKMRLNH